MTKQTAYLWLIKLNGMVDHVIHGQDCCPIKSHVQGLGVTSKNESFKNDFFSWSKFCYCTKLKAKYVFLTKTMLSNETKAFFVSLYFSR